MDHDPATLLSATKHTNLVSDFSIFCSCCISRERKLVSRERKCSNGVRKDTQSSGIPSFTTQ